MSNDSWKWLPALPAFGHVGYMFGAGTVFAAGKQQAKVGNRFELRILSGLGLVRAK